MNKLFGTDGIRGLANSHPMTSEIAVAVGRAIAHVLQSDPGAQSRTSLPVGLKPLEHRRRLIWIRIRASPGTDSPTDADSAQVVRETK